MKSKLMSSKELRGLAEDFALLGRQSFADLSKDEKESMIDECIRALTQSDIAEIVLCHIDESKMHELIAEAVKAKSNLFLEDALFEIVPEAKRVIAVTLEEYIDEIIGETSAEIRYETSRVNNYLNRHVFNNSFDIIQGGI